MIKPTSILVLLATSVTLACSAPQPPRAAAEPQPPADVVAIVGGQRITMAELEDAAGPKLTTLKQQIYDQESEALKQLIFKRLQEQEAKAKGTTTEALYAENVTDKVTAPSEEEVKQILDKYRGRLSGDEVAARQQVTSFLEAQKKQQAEQAWMNALMASHNVTILLEPPRMKVAVAPDDPSRGPADAPVTIVEFSDFQCPYCSRSQAVVKQVEEQYGDKIRWVFKEVPLPMHPDARFAAKAALCAHQQGKFWELHTWMFEHQGELKKDPVTAEVKALGMDPEAFSACVDAPATTKRLEQDMSSANALGITGTPAFIINGRLLIGAQPLEAFQQVIDDELRRAGAAGSNNAS